MTSEKKELLDAEMKILLKAKCTKIGRSCNLVWLHFMVGDSVFILDTQSAFRFSKNNEILCANLDMYEPKKIYQEDSDFDYEKFNWDVQGENFFDDWINSEGKKIKNSNVEQVSLSDYGDLTVHFDNGIKFEIFNNSLSECWRFFGKETALHTVVSGNAVD